MKLAVSNGRHGRRIKGSFIPLDLQLGVFILITWEIFSPIPAGLWHAVPAVLWVSPSLWFGLSHCLLCPTLTPTWLSVTHWNFQPMRKRRRLSFQDFVPKLSKRFLPGFAFSLRCTAGASPVLHHVDTRATRGRGCLYKCPKWPLRLCWGPGIAIPGPYMAIRHSGIPMHTRQWWQNGHSDSSHGGMVAWWFSTCTSESSCLKERRLKLQRRVVADEVITPEWNHFTDRLRFD